MFFDQEAFDKHLRAVSRARNIVVDGLTKISAGSKRVMILGGPPGDDLHWLEHDGLKRSHMIAGNRVVEVLSSVDEDAAETADIIHVTDEAWSRGCEVVRWLTRASNSNPDVPVIIGPIPWPVTDYLRSRRTIAEYLKTLTTLHIIVPESHSMKRAHQDCEAVGLVPTTIRPLPSPAYSLRWELIHEEDFERGTRNLIIAYNPEYLEESGMVGWETVEGGWCFGSTARNCLRHAADALEGAGFVATDDYECHLACMLLDVPHYYYAEKNSGDWHEMNGLEIAKEWFSDDSYCQMR